jgi:type I restriction enzyme S subunit
MAKDEKSTVTPRLRFPEFRKAEGWPQSTLSDIATFHKGRGVSKAEVVAKGDRPCIRYGELYTKYGEVINEVISRTNSPISELFLSRANDVIIPASGETKLDIAKASCVMSDGIALGSDLNVLRTSHNGIFLSYLINGTKRFAIASVAQGDTVVHLYPSQLEQISVAVPSLTEQQKIAECLMSLDEVIAAQGRKATALAIHKRGLMQQLFPRAGETIPRLRFPEFRDLPEWEEKSAGALFENRITKGEEGLPIYSVTMHDGMVRRDSFDRNYYDIEDAAANKKACKNDIAYNMMRMWQGALGVAPENCLVSPAYVVLAPKERVVSRFFEFFFKLPSSLLFLTSHSRGLTKDRLRLYYDDFARIQLRCPGHDEQQRIADCLSAFDALISAESEKLNALNAHKKGLMQQLFPSPELD